MIWMETVAMTDKAKKLLDWFSQAYQIQVDDMPVIYERELGNNYVYLRWTDERHFPHWVYITTDELDKATPINQYELEIESQGKKRIFKFFRLTAFEIKL
jgi:hypothetical protein